MVIGALPAVGGMANDEGGAGHEQDAFGSSASRFMLRIQFSYGLEGMELSFTLPERYKRTSSCVANHAGIITALRE